LSLNISADGQQVGRNAIRGAHAPMDNAFYELCDRMGLLLLDEDIK
jgi:beta-galactosidase/beta-glucuronidase